MAGNVIFVRSSAALRESLRRMARRERLSVSRLAAILLRRAVASDDIGARDLVELESACPPKKC